MFTSRFLNTPYKKYYADIKFSEKLLTVFSIVGITKLKHLFILLVIMLKIILRFTLTLGTQIRYILKRKKIILFKIQEYKTTFKS